MDKKRIIPATILLICIFCSLITASVAWFVSFVTVHTEGEFSASSMASYFAGGKGTENDPYIINRPHHLYNLSWLQNTGSFGEEKYYFKVCERVEIGEDGNPIYYPTTIDMGGALDNDSGKSGAIPPIGTKDEPFVGYFDGCGSVISNLWVSTDKNDWKEHPDIVQEDYESTHVGLFGSVGEEAIVEDFVLDRIEIKSHINESKVGIICGYVNAMIKNVGVYNGIITVAANTTCTSNYSLFGEKDSRIYWDDMPIIDSNYEADGTEKEGGDLIVDPNAYDYKNDPDYETKYLFTGLEAADDPKQILDSIPRTAYYVGELNTISSGNNHELWDLREYDPSTNKGANRNFVATTKNMEKIAQLYALSKRKDPILEIGNPFAAFSGGTATPLATKDVVNKEGETVKVPQGCIWFKPQNSGTVSLAFGATSNGSDRYAMVYACRRIDANTLVAVEARSQEFMIPSNKLNTFKNGYAGYYEYEITDEDIANNYEFVIGASNLSGHTNGAFGFLFLILAGVDKSGEEGGTVERPGEPGVFAPIMFDVDYVVSPATDISKDTYQNHQVLLKVSTAPEGQIYYLAAGPEGSSKVYYTATATGATLLDFAAADPKQSQSAAKGQDLTGNGVYFQERDEESTSGP